MNNNGWGKIMVGARLEKFVVDDFLAVWTSLLTQGMRSGDRYGIARGQVAHRAANSLARQLLQSDCDSLFFIDSDADVDPDFLNRFRDFEPGFDYDVLQAFYLRRGWPPEAIWLKRDSEGILKKCVVYGDATEDVAIAGLHACLIRRQVFEKMLGKNDPATFDWFYYPQNTLTTEDAAFSQMALNHGFRIGATTAVKANHIAQLSIGWETYQDYLYSSGYNDRVARYSELMELLIDYTGEDEDHIANRASKSAESITKAWQDANPQSPAACREFYGAADNGYLYDLFHWNIDLYNIKLTRGLEGYRSEDALVIGGGLGTEAVTLARRDNTVDVYELPGILRHFLRFRFARSGYEAGRIRLIEYPTLQEAKLDDYSLVVLIDVVEHVHPDELDSFLAVIDGVLRPGGVLYCHNNFTQQEIFPMHFDHSERWAAWLTAVGLKQETSLTWRKPPKEG